MSPLVILFLIGALVVLGGVLFMVFRSWGTMPSPTRIPPLAPGSIDLEDDPEIQRLVAQGNKIQAIKRVRELTGLGLKESKDYVEGLAQGLPPTYTPGESAPSAPSAALEHEIGSLLAQRHKIQAIKRVREQTGMSLKQAKDYVESLEARI